MTDNFFVNFLQHAPYVGLFAVLFIAGLGVPLPEDIPLLVSGWLVYKGRADLIVMMSVGLIGVLVGDTLLFSMGRRYGSHILEHKWLRRIAPPALLHRAEALFAAHGAKIIFVARFMPGIRSVIFLTAGVFRVPRFKFMAIDGSAAVLSVPLLIYLGYRFGGAFDRLAEAVRQGQLVGVGILALIVAVWGLWEYQQVRKRKRLAAEEAAKMAAAAATRVPRDVPGPIEPVLRERVGG